MNVNRRKFLLMGAAVSIVMTGERLSLATLAAGLPNPLVVAISGVDASSHPGGLARLVGPFIERSVPVLLTISAFDNDGKPLEYGSEMAQWLRERVRDNFDDLEIGLHVDTIDVDDPYFQLRLASEAQAVLIKALNDFARYRTQAIVKAKTLTTLSPLRTWHDCSAMRAADLRSVIHLPGGLRDTAGLQPADGGYWTTNSELVNIFGSRDSSIRRFGGGAASLDIDSLVAGVERLAGNDEPVILDIPFQQLAARSKAELATHGEALARAVQRMVEAGTARHTLPRDLYRQSRPTNRYVIVRVDDLRLTQDGDAEHMAFTRKLIEAGYPVSEAVIPAPLHGLVSVDETSRAFMEEMSAKGRYDVATHGWHHTFEEMLGRSEEENLALVRDGASELYRATGWVPMSYVPPNNAFDQHTLDALARTGALIMAADKGEDLSWFTGMDRRGLLHISDTVMFEKEWSGDVPYLETSEVLERLGVDNDAVFSIHPLTANTPEKQRRILDTLEALTRQRGTKLANFSEYYQAVVPPMPRAERIRQARTDVMVRDWRPPSHSAAAEAALKEDAAFAWRYFEWGAANFGGMVPATAWMEGSKRQGYPFATMWDVASCIMAAISAHRIDLIDDRRFEKTARRILAFLDEKHYSFRGAKLPPTERSFNANGKERRGFDSADTGRLLIALKILESYTEGELPVAKLVAGWDFGPVLTDGKMHIVSRGRFTPVHDNSYANYVSRGYRLWGHTLKPVFDTMHPDTDMDEAISTVAEIARRGRIATEPHLTEEIELGGSPHGRLMADILQSAQMRRYAEKGILTCVSEGPVRGAPFFVYQGYQIEEDGGHFVVDAPRPSAIAQTASRQGELRAVSTKGAYLWHAARPGEYSTRLLEFARERGKAPGIGFASGISEATGRRFEVSDVNTNGIIVAAAAYVLGGRQPFLPDSAESETGTKADAILPGNTLDSRAG